MKTHNNTSDSIPSFMSVTQMCQLMNISRSRFYQLLDQGVLLQPVYLLSNRRPYYTHEMANINLQVIQNNQGVNGEVLIFYQKRSPHSCSNSAKSTRPLNESENRTQQRHKGIIEALKSLGIDKISDKDVDIALKQYFPQGYDKEDESVVLRTIYRYFRSLNSKDNVSG